VIICRSSRSITPAKAASATMAAGPAIREITVTCGARARFRKITRRTPTRSLMRLDLSGATTGLSLCTSSYGSENQRLS
jgi:hypothetical protein